MENNGNKGKKINKEKRKQTVNKSKNVQKVNNKRKIDIKKLLKKPCRFIGILGLSLALPTFGAYSGYKDVSDKQKIEKNAESEKIRSFRNLKEEDMGKYVKDTINRLYKDYPDLDYMIYLKDERTKDSDFINDIFNLYKAFILDKYNKTVDDIDAVKIIATDHILWGTDGVYENNEKLLETFKEKYKGITNRFVEAKKNRDASVILAKEIYELLALELGVEERQKEDDDRIQIIIPNAQLEEENSIEETQREEQQGLPYMFPTFQNEEERE